MGRCSVDPTNQCSNSDKSACGHNQNNARMCVNINYEDGSGSSAEVASDSSRGDKVGVSTTIECMDSM